MERCPATDLTPAQAYATARVIQRAAYGTRTDYSPIEITLISPARKTISVYFATDPGQIFGETHHYIIGARGGLRLSSVYRRIDGKHIQRKGRR